MPQIPTKASYPGPESTESAGEDGAPESRSTEQQSADPGEADPVMGSLASSGPESQGPPEGSRVDTAEQRPEGSLAGSTKAEEEDDEEEEEEESPDRVALGPKEHRGHRDSLQPGLGQKSVSPVAPPPPLSYSCCWDLCQFHCTSSPDLAEHLQERHVDAQTGGVFVCLWKGCKVYNTPSTSQSWLQRHLLSHSGDKPFKCLVEGCTATFSSQGGLARHVPTHFTQSSSRVPGHSRVLGHSRGKDESPSKAGLKRRKARSRQRRSLPRPHDFFDAQTMDAIRHRAICLNLATHIESLGSGHSVVFHSTVIARRREDSGKVKVLLHWTPEDILPDVWVNETERLQQKTRVVHLSKLPTDTAVLLDPNVYRMFF